MSVVILVFSFVVRSEWLESNKSIPIKKTPSGNKTTFLWLDGVGHVILLAK